VAPEAEQRVAPLELFFDLVFVFAITQVTVLMAADPTPAGVLRGMLVLAAVWWAWAAYAWLTNQVDPNESKVRLPVFAAMGAMLVASLAVPGAFEDSALLFAIAYLVVRVLHIIVFAEASDDVEVMAAVRAMAPTALLAPALLIVAAFLDGPAQVTVWVVALVIDYGGAGVRGIEGWHLSPGHFAERHGLIMIIALGESIVAIGVGAGDIGLGAGVVAAAALGVAIAAALWWAYFDVVAPVAERTLREAPRGRAQNTMARDSYSYLHLPMVAGIVLLALGVKKTLGHVDEPLSTVAAAALCGGAALYLLALVAFRLRNVRSVNRQRLVSAAFLLALIPVATQIPALIALGAVALICAALISYEAIHFREARARVRLAG
jgi:low temperature requirement protein LtrA